MSDCTGRDKRILTDLSAVRLPVDAVKLVSSHDKPVPSSSNMSFTKVFKQMFEPVIKMVKLNVWPAEHKASTAAQERSDVLRSCSEIPVDTPEAATNSTPITKEKDIRVSVPCEPDRRDYNKKQPPKTKTKKDKLIAALGKLKTNAKKATVIPSKPNKTRSRACVIKTHTLRSTIPRTISRQRNVPSQRNARRRMPLVFPQPLVAKPAVKSIKTRFPSAVDLNAGEKSEVASSDTVIETTYWTPPDNPTDFTADPPVFHCGETSVTVDPTITAETCAEAPVHPVTVADAEPRKSEITRQVTAQTDDRDDNSKIDSYEHTVHPDVLSLDGKILDTDMDKLNHEDSSQMSEPETRQGIFDQTPTNVTETGAAEDVRGPPKQAMVPPVNAEWLTEIKCQYVYDHKSQGYYTYKKPRGTPKKAVINKHFKRSFEPYVQLRNLAPVMLKLHNITIPESIPCEMDFQNVKPIGEITDPLQSIEDSESVSEMGNHIMTTKDNDMPGDVPTFYASRANDAKNVESIVEETANAHADPSTCENELVVTQCENSSLVSDGNNTVTETSSPTNHTFHSNDTATDTSQTNELISNLEHEEEFDDDDDEVDLTLRLSPEPGCDMEMERACDNEDEDAAKEELSHDNNDSQDTNVAVVRCHETDSHLNKGDNPFQRTCRRRTTKSGAISDGFDIDEALKWDDDTGVIPCVSRYGRQSSRKRHISDEKKKRTSANKDEPADCEVKERSGRKQSKRKRKPEGKLADPERQESAVEQENNKRNVSQDEQQSRESDVETVVDLVQNSEANPAADESMIKTAKSSPAFLSSTDCRVVIRKLNLTKTQIDQHTSGTTIRSTQKTKVSPPNSRQDNVIATKIHFEAVECGQAASEKMVSTLESEEAPQDQISASLNGRHGNDTSARQTCGASKSSDSPNSVTPAHQQAYVPVSNPPPHTCASAARENRPAAATQKSTTQTDHRENLSDEYKKYALTLANLLRPVTHGGHVEPSNQPLNDTGGSGEDPLNLSKSSFHVPVQKQVIDSNNLSTARSKDFRGSFSPGRQLTASAPTAHSGSSHLKVIVDQPCAAHEKLNVKYNMYYQLRCDVKPRSVDLPAQVLLPCSALSMRETPGGLLQSHPPYSRRHVRLQPTGGTAFHGNQPILDLSPRTRNVTADDEGTDSACASSEKAVSLRDLLTTDIKQLFKANKALTADKTGTTPQPADDIAPGDVITVSVTSPDKKTGKTLITKTSRAKRAAAGEKKAETAAKRQQRNQTKRRKKNSSTNTSSPSNVKEAAQATQNQFNDVTAGGDLFCGACGVAAEFICSGCQGVSYCSVQCQTEDWKRKHHTACS